MNPPNLLITLLLLVASPLSAADRGWDHLSFNNPEQVVEYFNSIQYTLANWQAGDRSVPRVYLSTIPDRWRAHYAGELSTADKKRYFFFILAPMVLRANETIARQRAFVEGMQQVPQWTDADTAQLRAIAEEYGVAAPASPGDSAAFAALLARVDVVPASLAMAQAAIESGWGTSRFASEGNALFGQWTWGEGAIAPERVRTELGNYGIKAFKTPFESITAYMHNLNTHQAYAELRRMRSAARSAGEPLSGKALAAGLLKYSERGEAYVKELRALIRVNRLSAVDQAYLRDDKAVVLEPVGDGV
ncbi:glucosaminidase domain-containing protein [Ketobacter sp.]|uniref:glucosaminidase domain-containing protein n=1 Tax=Ketobacter sp. TaxID=2083498 RepID=UPI0025BB5FE2|nr:glucosaminidase domain-containing protein [Ketobacter sp.]